MSCLKQGKRKWQVTLTLQSSPRRYTRRFGHISLTKASYHMAAIRSTEAGKCESATCLTVGRARNILFMVLLTVTRVSCYDGGSYAMCLQSFTSKDVKCQ